MDNEVLVEAGGGAMAKKDGRRTRRAQQLRPDAGWFDDDVGLGERVIGKECGGGGEKWEVGSAVGRLVMGGSGWLWGSMGVSRWPMSGLGWARVVPAP